MPFYSDDLVEEVRTGNNIVDVISEYVKLQKKGGSYVGLCPFHNEKTPSFSVSESKQLYYCFGCGAGGNVFSFLMDYENLTFAEAVRELADRAGIKLPQQEDSLQKRREADKKQRILEVNKEAAKYYYRLLRSSHGQAALAYFKKRGLSDETMRRFGLGYSDKFSDDLYRYLRSKGYEDALLKESGLIAYSEKGGSRDRFWNRAMFPIMDIRGKVIGFGGRVMGEGEPKYVNSPETVIFDKSRSLYGLNFARTTKKTQFLLCEGYMDVIALHQAGFDNAVASLGTAFTAGHANLLARYTKEVYLTYDSDGAGVRAALRAMPILKEAGIAAKVVDMNPYKDPDEFMKALGQEAYQKRIDAAENGFLFELRILKRDYNLDDPQGKTDFYNEAAKRLLGFSEELERNNYIEAVAKTYHIGLENLRKLVFSMGAKGMAPSSQRKGPGVFGSGAEKKKEAYGYKKKEDGIRQSQKILLTWLTEDAGLFPVVETYLTPEDFTEELYRKAASVLYGQLRENGTTDPAGIVSMFSDPKDQREIASLFNARMPGMTAQADTEASQMPRGRELEKALKEIIVRIKKNSIEECSLRLNPTDLAGLQKIVEDRKRLEQLEKLHISIE